MLLSDDVKYVEERFLHSRDEYMRRFRGNRGKLSTTKGHMAYGWLRETRNAANSA